MLLSLEQCLLEPVLQRHSRSQQLAVQFQLAASGRFSEYSLLKDYVFRRIGTPPVVSLVVCAALASHACGRSTIATCTHV